MMNFSMRTKSSLLALVALFSTVSVQTGPIDAICTYMANNKGKCTALALVIMAMKVRLDTRPRVHFSMDDFDQDLRELLSAYNIFDLESYKTVLAFFDKYAVGRPVKFEKRIARTKQDDGSVMSLEGKKLVQKPFGVMGLFDAYVLSQMKDLTDYIPVMAGFYVLVNDPYKIFSKSIDKCNAS